MFNSEEIEQAIVGQSKKEFNKDSIYLADQEYFYKHFQPASVLKTAIKCIVLSSCTVVAEYAHEYSEAVLLAEEENEQIVEPTFPPFNVIVLKSSISFIKNIAATTVTRSLEITTLRHFSIRFGGKMLKNVKKSAIRKSTRIGSRKIAAKLLLKTALRASFLPHLATFIVDEVAYGICILVVSKKKEEQRWLMAEESFGKMTAKNVLRLGGSWIGAAVGASLGTLIRPGSGTLVAINIQVIYIYMNIDDLLDEMNTIMDDTTSASLNIQPVKRTLKSHITTSKVKTPMHTSCDELLDFMGDSSYSTTNSYTTSAISNSSNKTTCNKKQKCNTVYLGETEDCCDNIRCTGCDFSVCPFKGSKWKSSVEYMFFREHMPDREKLATRLTKDTTSTAYCCQCQWMYTSSKQRCSISKWVCGGHA